MSVQKSEASDKVDDGCNQRCNDSSYLLFLNDNQNIHYLNQGRRQ